MIIFDSVRFLPIKITKPNFFILKNQNWTEIESNRPVSIRFGYFILKTKNYIVFGFFFFVISNWFGFGLARFFSVLVWFGFSVSSLWNQNQNQTGWFLKYSNQFNWSVFLFFLLTPTFNWYIYLNWSLNFQWDWI